MSVVRTIARMQILLWIFLVFTCAEVFAAPAITSISGAISDGASITITGTSFGTKTPVAPISWDNFENKTVGADVHNTTPIDGHTWTVIKGSPGADAVKYNDARAHSGSKSIKISWLAESINAFGWGSKGPYTQLYVTYWRYQTGTYVQGVNNHKQFYVYGNYTVSELPQAVHFIPASNDKWAWMNNQNECGLTPSGTDVTYNQTKDVWNRWEFWIKLNTPTIADGVVMEWIDNVHKINRTDYKHRCDDVPVSGQWKDFRLGHMFQGPGAGPPEALKEAWFDDVYIDITRARVEVCNSATWASRTHCEIQRPTAWADTVVTVTLNKGSFNDPALFGYLYVIDADGNANANGYTLSLLPNPPSGLTVR
jgi:hypothetical protein